MSERQWSGVHITSESWGTNCPFKAYTYGPLLNPNVLLVAMMAKRREEVEAKLRVVQNIGGTGNYYKGKMRIIESLEYSPAEVWLKLWEYEHQEYTLHTTMATVIHEKILIWQADHADHTLQQIDLYDIIEREEQFGRNWWK